MTSIISLEKMGNEIDIESNNKDVFLSICIPTYNRIGKTSKLVESILTYESDDIEVVVLDNCSTDDTFSLLSRFKDSRFKYIRNNEAIGGMPNILKSLTHGSGKYVLLCLDKDSVLPKNIAAFTSRLKNGNIDVGQCSLNYENSVDAIYNKGIESVLNIAYTSEHPSGLFIKNSVLKEYPIIDDIITKYRTFAFLPELLKSEVAVRGSAARISMPLIVTETREECGQSLSHTYKGNNIYFMPQNLICRFNTYLRHIQGLKLASNDKIILIEKNYTSLLFSATIGYQAIMKDKDICNHHGIQTEQISNIELIKFLYQFNKNYFQTKTDQNVINKLRVAFYNSAKIIVKMMINR